MACEYLAIDLILYASDLKLDSYEFYIRILHAGKC